MKSWNAQIVRLLQYVRFVYKTKNASFVRRLSNIVKNVQNIKFVIYIIFEKKDVNIL